ncbi:actinia tenebrosa protease inhibitors-like [Dermacentor silvarum]|uniref:actinia tenebrosa protease inhibitors-like n=1 Tax=Dermacentor silvarum TaxID=543639 RepID=UPI002101CEFF|nr:actinia tenebrosa protease inhibitors-like [Dermacentor silvarum]
MRRCLLALLLFLKGLHTRNLQFPLSTSCTAPHQAPCRMYFPKWMYNRSTKYCELESYGGCFHIGSFDTEEQCNVKCREFAQDPCFLPLVRGTTCKDGTPGGQAFYFNRHNKRCESFYYNGCAGNGNNFQDEKDCCRMCVHHIKNPWNMPISDGHACPHRRKGGYMAYGYSWKTQKCHRFWHKGCGGNNNQFTAAENCWKTCAELQSEIQKPLAAVGTLHFV